MLLSRGEKNTNELTGKPSCHTSSNAHWIQWGYVEWYNTCECTCGSIVNDYLN